MKPLIPIADNLAVTGQIDRADLADFAKAGYQTIINNRPDGEEFGQLSSNEARAEAERLGLTYVYLPVTGATLTRDTVAAFEDAVRTASGPIVAHCRSGTRCYLLWALGQALNGGGDPQSLVAQARAKGYDISPLLAFLPRMQAM